MKKLFRKSLIVFTLPFLMQDVHANPNEFFPENSAQSYQKLHALCQRGGVVCQDHKVAGDLSVGTLLAEAAPRAEDQRGAEDQHNTGAARKILVLVSGTHGVETYAGAAIQFQFLQNNLSKYLQKGISVLLIHGLNPWGFAHGRRVTEQNQDLNRTFPSKDDEQNPLNEGYTKLKPLLQPSAMYTSDNWQFTKFAAKILWKVATFQFSVKEMNQAVAGGQRSDAKGLFYGGGPTPPQVLWLQRFLDERSLGFNEAVMIDLHTGLGEKAMLHLMASDEPSQSGAALRDQLFAIPKVEGSYKFTTKEAKGFYKVAGDFLDFAEERGPENLKIAALTMEFGTRGVGIPSQLQTLFTMVAENESVHNGWLDSRKAKAEDDMLELFAPRDPEWRKSVLQKADQLFEQIYDRF